MSIHVNKHLEKPKENQGSKLSAKWLPKPKSENFENFEAYIHISGALIPLLGI
jgi:hypothetical protein